MADQYKCMIIEVDGRPSVKPKSHWWRGVPRRAWVRNRSLASVELSAALKRISSNKVNNDVVVPRGRLPFALVARIAGLWPPMCFSAGDGIMNIMVPHEDEQSAEEHRAEEPRAEGKGQETAKARARQAERQLFEGVVALEGSISGEHGIGFTKAPYLGLELSPEEIALMKRVKAAFDPHGIMNPGKIFPDA